MHADGDLAAEVAQIQWYHTMELRPGVVTPGYLDTRPVVERLPLPRSVAGLRCLDVATFNGFWAFEMERRGSDDVVAIDVLDPAHWDWPVASTPDAIEAIGARHAGGRGFDIAKRELGSAVQRVERSVYELDPEQDGTFDLVYLGSLLVHLRDPVRALERIRLVCRGTLVVVDGIDLPLSLMLPRLPVARFDGRGRPVVVLERRGPRPAGGVRRLRGHRGPETPFRAARARPAARADAPEAAADPSRPPGPRNRPQGRPPRCAQRTAAARALARPASRRARPARRAEAPPRSTS